MKFGGKVRPRRKSPSEEKSGSLHFTSRKELLYLCLNHVLFDIRVKGKVNKHQLILFSSLVNWVLWSFVNMFGIHIQGHTQHTMHTANATINNCLELNFQSPVHWKQNIDFQSRKHRGLSHCISIFSWLEIHVLLSMNRIQLCYNAANSCVLIYRSCL